MLPFHNHGQNVIVLLSFPTPTIGIVYGEYVQTIGSISKYYCCCSLLHVLFCGTVFPRLSSGVSPRYFYCGKTTVTSVQAVTVIKHNYRYCATRYREKTHLQIPCKTEEFIFSPYRKTNYRAKSGVPAISGYRGVNFRNYDKTPTTAQK